jgi:hypothetical protein
VSGVSYGWSSGQAYGKAVGDAVITQLHLPEVLYKAGMGSTDSATLELAYRACAPASASVYSSLYFSHEGG